MTTLSLASLREAISNPEVALIRFAATYQPGGGPGSRIFPPTFPTSRNDESPYLLESRMRDGGPVETVVLDQVPSQANRCTEAIKTAWRAGMVRLPMLRLVHSGPVSVEITGLDAPHRAFDAYWRDSLLGETKFDQTPMGKALQAASLEDARALLEYDPATIVYGGWNSHRKGRQAKFPRLYSSEMVGWQPVLGVRKAGRMDPLNLTGARSGDGDAWTYSAVAAKTAKAKLSEIGHGNIAPNSTHGGVTITEATRYCTLSLSALRRVRFGDLPDEAQVAARAYLATFALLGDRLTFGGAGVWLRSGCELVVESESIEWVLRGGVCEPFTLTTGEAVTLYAEALDAALRAGVTLHLATVDLVPSKALGQAMDFSLTKAETSGD